MLTSNWAVQPAAFGNFDERGCEWAIDIQHAYRLADAFGEPCVIWCVPHVGAAYKWCRAGVDATEQIADLLYGVDA